MSNPQPNPHTHKYVIPVEWEDTERQVGSRYQRLIGGKKVIKLRCECGEEIIR